MAKLAQKAGVPLTEAGVSFQSGSTDRNLVLIGAVSQIPADVMQAAPFNLGATNKVGYEQPLLRTLGKKSAQSEVGVMRADIEGTGGLGTLGIAMQFRSPYSAKSVFMITADNPELLQKRTAQLVSPAFWGSLNGDVCVWDDGYTVVVGQKIGQTFDVGSVSLNTRVDYFTSRNPLPFILGVLALLIILALVVRRLLNNYKRHHHGKSESSDTR